MPSFESIEADFLRITSEVAWATVATVDGEGRPRTRILHPYWEAIDGRPVGWVGTSRSALKTKHLDANPHVSVAYWSPKQETAFAECRGSWADDERERVWNLYLEAEPPARLRPGQARALEGRPARRRLLRAAPRPLARDGADERGRGGGPLLPALLAGR